MADKAKGTRKDKRREARARKRQGNKYNQWSEDRMKGAVLEYEEQLEAGHEPKLRMLARAWNVPKSTLQRRVKGTVKGHKHVSGRSPVLMMEQEEELVTLIKHLAKRGFPLRRQEIQALAYQYAAKHNLIGFSKKNKRAGQYWFDHFLARHPDLSLKKPEGLSSARAAGLNPTVVSKWFDCNKQVIEELGIHDLPSHIWNCDETGMQDHFVSQRVVAEVGHACYEVTAGEKGETTTALASFNAVGDYMPLLIIFKGKRLKADWLYQAPPRTLVRVSDNGWINSELMLEWGRLFVKSLPKEDQRPHLLLLDGHSSHVYNLTFLTLMKEHNVHVMCYPPHTTHCLQPADKSLFKSLKNSWNDEGRRFTRETGSKVEEVRILYPVFPSMEKSCNSRDCSKWVQRNWNVPSQSGCYSCRCL